MKKSYLLIFALLISFGSIGAVSYTPSLPEMVDYFGIDSHKGELTIMWYLVGYAFGPLLYGPLASRFGSKNTIRIGAILEILGCLGCISAYFIHSFSILTTSLCIMALGASSGAKMTFTMLSKLFTPQENSHIMGLLTMAFAITPGLGVFLGGILTTHFNWTAPFYFMLFYGLLILLVSNILPEVYSIKDYKALKIKSIFKNYYSQFKNSSVTSGGLLLGAITSVVYVFAAIAPFIAMNMMHLTPALYGTYNFIPCLGILIGSLLASHLGKIWLPKKSLKFGLFLGFLGTIILLFSLTFYNQYAFSLFLPMVIIYIGTSFVFANSATLALKNTHDKSNGSAVMSFINMSSALVLVALISCFKLSNMLILPLIYFGLLITGMIWYKVLTGIKVKVE